MEFQLHPQVLPLESEEERAGPRQGPGSPAPLLFLWAGSN
jgi:hypothetical protein